MFKVAILQKRSINEQIDKNIETIIMAMEEASENHADILLLPECFITGYEMLNQGKNLRCVILKEYN